MSCPVRRAEILIQSLTFKARWTASENNLTCRSFVIPCHGLPNTIYPLLPREAQGTATGLRQPLLGRLTKPDLPPAAATETGQRRCLFHWRSLCTKEDSPGINLRSGLGLVWAHTLSSCRAARRSPRGNKTRGGEASSVELRDEEIIHDQRWWEAVGDWGRQDHQLCPRSRVDCRVEKRRTKCLGRQTLYFPPPPKKPC